MPTPREKAKPGMLAIQAKIKLLPALNKMLWLTAAEWHAGENSIAIMLGDAGIALPGEETLAGANAFCESLNETEFEEVAYGIHDDRAAENNELEDPGYVAKTLYAERSGNADWMLWSDVLNSCY